MQRLSIFTKEEQEDLLWYWYDHRDLQLIYKDFDHFYKVQENKRLQEHK